MIPFVKLHGLGNHFVLVAAETVFGLDLADFSRRVCDRTSVGADGVLMLSTDLRLRIFNSDGSEAQHCGNGLRCVGRFLRQLHAEQDAWMISLPQGEVLVRAVGDLFEVQMEEPKHTSTEGEWEHWAMRNPHAVLWRDHSCLGTLRQMSERRDTNAHVAWAESDVVRVVTWERGAGPTDACGTGATAVAASWFVQNPGVNEVTVRMPGGELTVTREWILRGPAVWVFTGELDF